jgi:hypothetical protein
MAAFVLVAAAVGAVQGVRSLWPNPAPPRTALSNYAILVDRSESMSSPFGPTTRLTGAAGELLTAVDEDEEIARALWYFGGGCDAVSVDQSVGLDAGNASSLRSGLENPPVPQGERPLIDALVAAVTELATVATNVGGDVSTDRRIVVFTDGPDTCGDDPTRVSSALAQSAIAVQFNIVGIDLDSAALRPLQALARSLPRAELIQADTPSQMGEVVPPILDGNGDPATTSTTSTSPTSTIPTSTSTTSSSTIPMPAPSTTSSATTAPRRRRRRLSAGGPASSGAAAPPWWPRSGPRRSRPAAPTRQRVSR